MNDCIFCKIIKGIIPNHTVYEDENFLAFLDIRPHAKGHTVVIPKKHVVSAVDLTELEYLDLMKKVRLVVKKLKLKLKPDGFNIGWNDGTAAGQVVPHLHVHIFPRYQGDGGGSMHSIVNNPGDSSVEEIARILE